MVAISAIEGASLRKREIIHVLVVVIPKKGAMMEPAVFAHILCIAAELSVAKNIIAFFELKGQFFEKVSIEDFAPVEDFVRTGWDLDIAGLEDKGYKECVLIDKNSAAAAEAFDNRDGCLLK